MERVAEATILGSTVLAADGCSVSRVDTGHYVLHTNGDGDHSAVKCFAPTARIVGIEKSGPCEWMLRFVDSAGHPVDDVGAYVKIWKKAS